MYNDTLENDSDWTPPFHLSDTALIDSAALLTLTNKKAKSKVAAVQESKKHLTIPNGYGIKITETIEFLRNKLPIEARRGV